MITPTTGPLDRTTQHDGGAHAHVIPAHEHRSRRGICWGSVLAGTIIAFATQIVLTLIGTAIGFATLDPVSGDSPSGVALASGAGIWLVITSLVSLFLGGYIAARLAGRSTGWLHGLTTWATLSLATLVLLTSAAGQLIGAASGLTSFAVNNSDKASQVQLPTAAQQQVDQMKAQAAQTGEQATAQVESTNPQAREAQARDAAQKAAKGSAAGSAAAAIAMILGAIAAAIGGKVGQRDPRLDIHQEMEPIRTNGQTNLHRA